MATFEIALVYDARRKRIRPRVRLRLAQAIAVSIPDNCRCREGSHIELGNREADMIDDFAAHTGAAAARAGAARRAARRAMRVFESFQMQAERWR